MKERLRILELVEAGEINAEEGARRLEALTEPAEASGTPAATIARPALVGWLWQVTFWLGILLLTWGGFLLVTFYTQEVAASRLTWGWILFVLGVLVTLLGWWMRRAHWLYVRVQPSDGPNIFIALPLPLSLAAWGLRIARPFAPQLQETAVDELLLAMQDELQDGQPLIVQVDEGERGERVHVYIG